MTMELIQTVTVGSGGASSIEFTDIPQDGTDLFLAISGRSNRADTYDIFGVRVNGAIASNRYFVRYIQATGSANSNLTSSSDYAIWGGYQPAASATSNTFGSIKYYFSNYANTTAEKVTFIESAGENNTSTAYMLLGAGIAKSTSAITSLMVWSFNSANFVQYSTASLYKITKA